MQNRFIHLQNAQWLDTFNNQEINSCELAKLANELDVKLKDEQQKNKNTIKKVYDAINERYNLEGERDGHWLW